jgi:bacterioferritin
LYRWKNKSTISRKTNYEGGCKVVDNKETIESLNKLLQGEYMAVEGFNTFIYRIEDEEIKKVFQEIQEQHRQNINKLANYIQNIGGRPHENLGMKGKMADINVNMDLGFKTDTAEIIKKAVEAETKGVNMAEKVLRGNLDDKSRDLAGEILHKDRSSIDKLNSLKQ